MVGVLRGCTLNITEVLLMSSSLSVDSMSWQATLPVAGQQSSSSTMPQLC